MSNNNKSRNYAFLLYPESINPKWKEILISLQQPFFWILHDKDYETLENGTVINKKPHYHVQLMFDNPRSESSISKLCVKCGGNGHLEDLLSAKGYARYLLHMDNPEKYQYSREFVHACCGADYDLMTQTDNEKKTNKLIMITEIFQFIDDNQIHIYSDLLRYCAMTRPDWLALLISYSGQAVKDYVKSEAFAFRSQQNGADYNRFFLTRDRTAVGGVGDVPPLEVSN